MRIIRWHPIWRGVMVVFGLLLVACATVPITGRQQFRFISNQELAAQADGPFAAFMTHVRQRQRLLTGDESPAARIRVDRINRVSARLVEAAGLTARYRWETVVVTARECN